ncbi:replication protein A 70 kDa DNA-binding subunit E-like isoform X3 [Tripterygium wilfordii]|uniref:replication protein A 70 kDa DNA-binding subunit E-like isoform X3 n=1 Tax=Tripterygium wilfordii TaxID=458696 RepID=UPI0018F83ED3|nr:replication protein A 70 kDa DNA-binding subunit E-like isoform X3 [Tripterygium wilfordii]
MNDKTIVLIFVVYDNSSPPLQRTLELFSACISLSFHLSPSVRESVTAAFSRPPLFQYKYVYSHQNDLSIFPSKRRLAYFFLQIGQRGCKIKCHVARMWKSINPTMQDQLMSVDFILVDTQGTSIQGTMRKEDAPTITELLMEGKTYILANFMVVPPRKSFRACPNDNMLRVGTWTVMKECFDTDSEFPLNKFHFIDEEEMENRIQNDILLTDIIGHLISVGTLTKVFSNGRYISKKNMVIQTLTITHISVTLWGTIAEGFDECSVLKLPKKEPLIVVLTGMTVRAFRAQTTLSSTSATKIYINLEIEEVQKFRQSLSYPNEVTFLETSVRHGIGSAEDSMMENKTISALLSLNTISDKSKQFSCEATITKVDASRGWWYNACAKCKAGISNYNGLLTCRKCGPIANLPIPWYMVPVHVKDDTGEAKFIMFGKHVERLLKISAYQLSQIPNSSRTTVPVIMEQLLGKKLIFTVSISEKLDNSENLTFKVAKVIDEQPIKTEGLQILKQQDTTYSLRTSSDEQFTEDISANSNSTNKRDLKDLEHNATVTINLGKGDVAKNPSIEQACSLHGISSPQIADNIYGFPKATKNRELETKEDNVSVTMKHEKASAAKKGKSSGC